MDKKSQAQKTETTVTEEEIHKFNEEEFQKLLDAKPWDSE